MKPEKHFQELEYFLHKMQRSPKHLKNFQVLRGGISGATTYRLQMTDEELVCKIVRTESEAGVLERARREMLFYQTLAPRLPIRVPQVISSIYDVEGIGLLLAAYQPSPAPAQWQKFDYEEVARQLGELHTTFWENTEQLTSYSWLRRHKENISLPQIQQASAIWQHIQEAFDFDLHSYQRIVCLLSLMPQVEKQLAGFALTLCHGDCHSENVLKNEQGELIWADWQEVGPGLGPADLSFFRQRAFFAGGTIPDEMITIYYEHLGTHIKQTFSPETLQRVMDVLEVRGWLLDWPPFLRQASSERHVQLLDRISLLSDRLHLD